MARIQTYPNDIFVTGNDKWIGSDANNDFITKNFTANAVADYFNRVGIIDTGSFNWTYKMYAPTETQPAKTFELVGHPYNTVDVIGLAGTIKVSFLTLANTEPGTFIEEAWLDKIILVSRPGFPSEYALYKVTAVVHDGDYYFLDLDFIQGNSGTITEDESVTFGLFSGVSGTSGTTGTSGTSGTTGTSGSSGTNGTGGTSGTTGTSGTSGTTGTSGSSGTDGTSGTSGTRGTSGTSGTDGSAGTSGTRGTSGTSGIDGIDGTSGSSGSSGTSGTDGTGGTSGTSGTDGTSGIDGTSGTDGTSGIDGTSGSSGSSGTTGTSGSSGTDGTGGTSGTNGTGGTSGTTGTSGTSGTTGTSGTGGTSGTAGTSGTNGVSNNFFLYQADTGVTSGYPGNGHILWNNATQINATQINISHITNDGVDIDIFLALLQDLQQITIQDQTNSSNYQVWDITATPTHVPTPNSYWIVPVALISSSGTGSTNFPNNQDIFLAVVSQSGTSGVNGTSGTSGTTGTSGTGGTSGVSGSSGTSGAAGTSGVSGTSGVNGTSGINGTSGVDGTSGTSGIDGTSGSSGSSGAGTILGTLNYVAKFTPNTTTVGDSNIQDDGSLITLGSNTNISSGALGIGPYSTVNYGLRVSKDITGGVNAVSIGADGTIKSDVTTSAINYRSGLTTDATSFTLPTFYHFAANQGTIGAGSIVTTQIAFFANANLNGATNNYGFYGNLQLASNSYNIYMPGTAANYIAGSLGIGSASLSSNGLADVSLRVSKNLTGATTNVVGVKQDGAVQSDATGIVSGYQNELITAAASFTVSNYYHFRAFQNVIGAGSAVTTQAGFVASGNIVSATNNYGFWGAIPSGGNRYNLYMSGTADNYFAGSLGIGSTTLTGFSLVVAKNITGAVNSQGIRNAGVIQSDVTGIANMYNSIASTAAGTYTTSSIIHYYAQQGTIGAGSVVSAQYGYVAEASLVGAGSNFGFYGNIPAAAGRWNLYMIGTANNYLAGSLGIGTTSFAGTNLSLNKNIIGGWLSTATYGVNMYSAGAVQSDVTTWAYYNVTRPSTAAAAFTMAGGIASYNASNVTIGSGSTVTSLIGYWVESTHIGGTNNFGFKSDLAANTNTWNFYGAGTANNYMAGSLGIGSTSLTAYNLRIGKTITGATSAFGVSVDSTIQSDVTSVSRIFYSNISTAAATFTLSALNHFQAEQATIGAGSTVTTQSGFVASSTLTGATNNYGFDGRIAAGTGRYNLYMQGTANNYLAGSLGIGTTGLTGYELRIGGSITGATTAYGVSVDGVIQSDVTSNTYIYNSQPSTVASAFTLAALTHFRAAQSTIGSGSTLTNQYGFVVDSSMTGATNNFGFFGNIAFATNRYNLYMAGTAGNYLGGSLGIGAFNITNVNLFISKTMTGSVDSYHVNVNGTVQSDVTNSATYFRSSASTAATTFTLGSLYHYVANQSTIGAGSTVTNQFGFRVESNLTGATNNYGFYGNLAAASNVWNLYMNGTANNYLAGSLGIGTTSLTGLSLAVTKTITGATTSYGIVSNGTAQSDVTSQAIFFGTVARTQATTYSLSALHHFSASQGTFGAGSTVTSQRGFFVESTLTGATNNHGFYGDIAAGTGRWNIYMNGTADNYLAGSLGIGTSSVTGHNLRIVKNLTGAVTAYNVSSATTIQSDVTTAAHGFATIMSTAAATFTLPFLYHYRAGVGSFGAGSTVTTQAGYWASSELIGATNNFGFYGDIASGTGRWNLYMNGTASNYINGVLSIGTTSPNASAKVQIDSTTQGFLPPRMTAAQRAAISTPADGLVVVQTDGTQGLYLYIGAAWHALTML